jgi:CBS domain-containing protein
MSLEQPQVWAPNLGDAIDRHPLIVPPSTPLTEVITLISQTHYQTCSLTDEWSPPEPDMKAGHNSCVLIMSGSTLLGILTERDVVRLTAKAINFVETTVAEVMVQPLITLPQKAVQDIFAALFLFRRYRIRHLPIVDEQGLLVGVISHESIRQILRPANLLRFRRVSDVMITQVIHAPLTTPVIELAQLMAENRVSCVVITQPDREDNAQPVGIITERDMVQFQSFQIDLYKTQAQTVMSAPLFLLSPEDSLWTAHQEMQKRRVGRLVVSWNWGQGLGIITQTSLLRVFDPMEMYGVIENLQQTIQQLEAEQSAADLLPNPKVPPKSFDLQKQASQDNSSAQVKTLAPQEHGLVLVNSIRDDLMQMITDPDLSVARQQLLLQSALDTLDQLNQIL